MSKEIQVNSLQHHTFKAKCRTRSRRSIVFWQLLPKFAGDEDSLRQSNKQKASPGSQCQFPVELKYAQPKTLDLISRRAFQQCKGFILADAAIHEHQCTFAVERVAKFPSSNLGDFKAVVFTVFSAQSLTSLEVNQTR